MKIALDATPLTVPTGGIRRYTEELTRALAENFPEDEFWLLSDQPFTAPAPRLGELKLGRGPRNALERRWWLCGLERRALPFGNRRFPWHRFRGSLLVGSTGRDDDS